MLSHKEAGPYQLNLMNHSIIPCADFSLAQPSMKQELMIIQDFQLESFMKHTTVFYIGITARSEAVCNTGENLNVICCLDLF